MTENEKKLLVELICNEQTHMIIKDHTMQITLKRNASSATAELLFHF